MQFRLRLDLRRRTKETRDPADTAVCGELVEVHPMRHFRLVRPEEDPRHPHCPVMHLRGAASEARALLRRSTGRRRAARKGTQHDSQ